MIPPRVSSTSLASVQAAGNSGKLLNIQALRGIAALMIVGFHALIYYFAAPNTEPLPIWSYVGASGVDVFFVISGFVMVYVTRAQFGTLANQITFLANRFTRVYPSYWVATLPVIIVCILLPQSTVIHLNWRTLFFAFTLFPCEEGFPLLRVGWTLTHEIYFYAVFSFFLLGKREHLGRKLFLWAIFVIVASLTLPARWQTIPFVQLVGNPLTLEFIAGCVLGLVIWPNGFKGGVWFFLGGFLLLLIAALNMSQVPDVSGWQRPLEFGIPSIFIVGGAIAMEGRHQILRWKPIQVFGDASFQIYLWHVTVISAVSRYSLRFSINNFVRLLLTIVSALVISYLAHRLIEKPLLKFTRSWRRNAS